MSLLHMCCCLLPSLQPVVSQHPLLELANSLFVLSLPAASVPAAERADLTARINAKIDADSMAPFLKHLQATQGWEVDPAKLDAMEKANAAALVAAEAKIVEATEVAGDTEVREAMLTRANLHAQWGDREKALEEYNLVFEKTVGVASKIDVLLARMRVALAFDDLKKFKHDVDKAKGSVSKRNDRGGGMRCRRMDGETLTRESGLSICLCLYVSLSLP